ncbi:YacL family protein [Agarivorans sp. TSD2052]|uniref:YacL family protein n=1 Tax=Agarivorans sp. TSD2052 TaxID=2937286 RepID=UPI00200ED174|nr:YacL family protein [Agarivorans sp. TSD2052]UPW17917.1 YacL family protein [Agarivorans sp. TSD2052]
MELTIRRSLDGVFFIDCGDEQRCFAMWLERELNNDRDFVAQLLGRLKCLQALDELRIDSAEFRFVANRDEVLIKVSTDTLGEDVIDQLDDLNLDAAESACGYDDFLLLLQNIIDY